MKKIKINKEQLTSPQVINTIAEHIRSGRVMVYPTDTVYGIGCLATDDRAVNEVYRIKKRERNKPLLVLVDSLNMATDHFYINKRQKEILKQYWPGPYSFILKEKGKLSSILVGDSDTIGVRLPKNDFVTKMIHRAGAPVVSTSLNISGERILDQVNDIEKIFTEYSPDVVVDVGKIENTRPSKLMDLTDSNDPKILRG
jgi:L-threonylcarbamoyladenylate synthase